MQAAGSSNSEQSGVVLVPGFMTDDSLWAAMATALSTAGPLHYANLNAGDSIAALARHVLAGCPPTFVLVGFSMGGYVAREIVRLAPQRVRALVLIASSARADTPLLARQRAEAAQAVPATAFRGLSRGAIAASLHPRLARDAAMVERVRAMGVAVGHDVFVRLSLLRRGDDRDRLGVIGCPTLVIAAAQDQLRGLDEARELVDGIPGATLHIIDDAGHMLPLEQPDLLARTMLTWLERLPQRALADGAPSDQSDEISFAPQAVLSSL
jgi:pimeloyl-ACP methyl ester carboxylesterase